MPKISVLMSVYNTPESFLREAIDSILNQTYTDFEYIIINDGSTNNVDEVISSYNDSRIVYVKQENQGLIKSLNTAIAISKGEYLARMDSDDISLLSRFEEQIKVLENNPQIGVCGTQLEMFGNSQVITNIMENPNYWDTIDIHWVINHPTVMMRKSLNVKYDENWLYCEDYALWLDLVQKSQFYNINKVLYKYRVHGENISVKKAKSVKFLCSLLDIQSTSKHFGLDYAKYADFYNRKNLSSEEMLSFADYLENLVKLIKNEHNNFKVKNFRRIYYCYLEKSKKDILYYKTLFWHPINKLLKINLFTKILKSIWR